MREMQLQAQEFQGLPATPEAGRGLLDPRRLASSAGQEYISVVKPRQPGTRKQKVSCPCGSQARGCRGERPCLLPEAGVQAPLNQRMVGVLSGLKCKDAQQ